MKDLRNKWGVTIGCDPELFIIRTSGKVLKRTAVVGSERIIPYKLVPGIDGSSVSRDGVQCELHAGGQGGCRQGLAYYVARALTTLNNLVDVTKKKDPTIRVSFQPMVTLTKRDISSLSADALELNCKPSLNAYGRKAIHRDGATYPIRTASGHLHLGTGLFGRSPAIDPDLGVKIFDLLVGIPTVLVDRDPSQRIRRETYGRAGEYRLPQHGLEYRVPSNFWLRDYKLLSMVFGLAKLAIRVCEGLYKAGDASTRWAKDAILDKVDFDEVERSINENDFDGALRIYMTSIRPIVTQITPYYGFGKGLMDDFDYFIETTHAKGLKSWFDLDDRRILNSWLKLDSHQGWERFLTEIVEPRRHKSSFIGIILDPAKVLKTAKKRSGSITKAEQASLRLAA